MTQLMKRFAIAAIIVTVALATAFQTEAQGITEQQATDILQELRAIRQLLERSQSIAPPRVSAPSTQTVKVPMPPAYVIGHDDAPLTMVEFTDLECPFCRRFHLSTFEKLKKEYIDTGKLRFISRDFPLPFHPNATKAAHASRCAGEQNRFWDMRHVLLASSAKLSHDAMLAFAQDLKLEMNQFSACFAGEKYKAEIQRDIADGYAVGVSGTPTFILGRTAEKAIEGVKIVGAVSYEVFSERISELLGERSTRP